MTASVALMLLNVALAVAYAVAAVKAEREERYAKGAYLMAWVVLFSVLALSLGSR